MSPTTILLIGQLVSLIPGAIAGVTSAVTALTHGGALLQKMASENRDPTPEEWADWETANLAAHNAIQNA